MLAAARGIRCTEPLTELLGPAFGVRLHQPDTLLRDLQVAHALDGEDCMPLTCRYYLSDAALPTQSVATLSSFTDSRTP